MAKKNDTKKPDAVEVYDVPNAMSKSQFQETQKEVRDMEQAVAQSGVQQMKTQYTTAVRVVKERNISDVLRNVETEVEFDPEAMFYAWMVTDRESGKKKQIKGGSIGLAMTIARLYGNCAVPCVMSETPTHFVFNACFIDLETGFTHERSYRQRKSQSMGGKYDNARAEDMIYQSGQSKAIRNVVLKCVPVSIVNKCVDKAMKLEADKWTPDKKQGLLDRLLMYFQGIKVTKEMLGNYFDEPDATKWTIEQLVGLGSVRKSIDNDEYSPSFFFPELLAKEQPKTEKKEDDKEDKKDTPEGAVVDQENLFE